MYHTPTNWNNKLKKAKAGDKTEWACVSEYLRNMLQRCVLYSRSAISFPRISTFSCILTMKCSFEAS